MNVSFLLPRGVKLDDIAIFVNVAECGSYTAAADLLGTEKSRLSRRVKVLEEVIGEQLLYRDCRKVVPTTFGRKILEGAREMMSAAERTLIAADVLPGAQQRATTLKLTCSHHLAATVMPALIARFCRQNQGVKITLMPTDMELKRFSEFDFDLAIRGRHWVERESQLIYEGVYEVPQVLAICRRLLDGRDPCAFEDPQEAADIYGVIAHEVQVDHGDLGLAGNAWHFRADGDRARAFPVRPRVVVGDHITMVNCLSRGMGVGLLPKPLFESMQASTDLVHLLPEWVGRAVQIYVIRPKCKPMRSVTSKLLSFLKYEMPVAMRSGTFSDGLPLNGDLLIGSSASTRQRLNGGRADQALPLVRTKAAGDHGARE